ncbi:MAG: TolC family protein [Chitinophagales bacterium]|nr:TolC family protein [Chitinophagaceae bacterium]MCB9066014.1 TolC family protein [Chitinophagales bacterium]
MRWFFIFINFLVLGTTARAQISVDGLDELLTFADRNSPAAKQTQLQPYMAKQERNMQAAVLYPKVNAFATGDYYPILATQLIPAEALGGAPGTYLKAQFGLPYVFATGAEVSMPIINMNNWAKLSRAKAQFEQSKYSSNAALENLHMQLIQSYYQTLVTKEVLKLNEENEKTATELLRIMTDRNEQGVVDPADYNRAKNLSLDVKAARISNNQTFQQSVNNLNALLGTDTVVLNEELDDFEWPMLYEPGNINNRPAWQEAAWKVRTAEMSLRESRTGGMPNLSVSGRYTYNMQTNFEPNFNNIDFNIASVSLRLNVPLFQGGYYHSMQQRSKLQLQTAKLEQKRTEDNLTKQQEDWLAQYTAEFNKKEVLTEKLATAKDNLRIAKLSTKEGVMEFDEFNTLFMEYNKARIEYLQNLADGILYHLLSTQNF